MFLVYKSPAVEAPELKSAIDSPDLSATTTFWKLLQTLPGNEPVPPAIINFGLLTRHLTPYPDDISVNTDEIVIEKIPEAVVPSETLQAVRYILAQHSDSLPPEERERIGNLCDATGLDRHPRNGDKEEDVATASTQQNPFSLSCFEEQSELSHSGSPAQSATTSTGVSPNVKQKDSENFNADQSRSKSGDKHTCPYCSESYHSEAALEGHKRKSHRTDSSKSDRSSSRRHKCRYCERKFKNKRRRAKHEKDCSGSKGSGGGSVGKNVKKDNRGERVAGKNPFADPKRLKDTGLHQGGG